MTQKIQTGGGRFDPSKSGKYFMAIDDHWFEKLAPLNPSDVLIPVDELGEVMESVEEHHNIFVDSGIFSLASAHAKKHGIPASEAFSADPSEVDGWDSLLNTYVSKILLHQDDLWGYVELDLGDQEAKENRREEMRSAGLSPIPVYSVAGDSWEYFEHLAQNYDRICVGSIAMVTRSHKKMVLAAICSHLEEMDNPPWVHFLGMTPGPMTNTFYPSSFDSTSWYSTRRFGNIWGINLEKASGAGGMCPPSGFIPDIGATSLGSPHDLASANKLILFSKAMRTHKMEQRSLIHS